MGTQSKVPSLVIHTLGVGSNCSVNVKFSQWLLLTLLVLCGLADLGERSPMNA